MHADKDGSLDRSILRELANNVFTVTFHLPLLNMLSRFRNLHRVHPLAVLFLHRSPGLVWLSTPSRPPADYIRTDFTVEDGLPSNVVNAIVQTRNGFLWVGTDAGLVRFNGSRFIPFELRHGQQTQGSVRALAEGSGRCPLGWYWRRPGAYTEGGSGRLRPVFDSFSSIRRPFERCNQLSAFCTGWLVVGRHGERTLPVER